MILLTRDLSSLRDRLLSHTFRRTERCQSRLEVQRAIRRHPRSASLTTNQLVFGRRPSRRTRRRTHVSGGVDRLCNFPDELEVRTYAQVDQSNDNTNDRSDDQVFHNRSLPCLASIVCSVSTSGVRFIIRTTSWHRIIRTTSGL